MNESAEYRELFVAEAQENLRALSDGALGLERPGGAREAVDGLFRAAHTVKGMSATMGFEGLTRICHAVEDALDALRSGARTVNPALADALLAAVDAMTAMLADVAAGGDGGPPPPGLLERFRGRPDGGEADGDAPEGEPPAVREALLRGLPVLKLSVALAPACAFKGVRAVIVLRELERLAPVLATRPEGAALEAGEFPGTFEVWTGGDSPAGDLEGAARRVLEVVEARSRRLGPAAPAADARNPDGPGLEPLDEALVGAPGARSLDRPAPAVAAPGASDGAAAGRDAPAPPGRAAAPMVRVSAERLDKVLDLVGELVTARIRLAQIAEGRANRDLTEALLQVEHIVNELQQEVTAARLVPVDQIFSRFPRLIRDLGREMGKSMELVLEGREIELDRGVLDELDEALVHLLRNAADHGIETPERRVEAGKPETGTIRLSAKRDRSHVVVTVEDDGAGIDMARVRQVAVDKGLLDAETVRSMDDEEALAFIFSPGFTTAGRVTRLSGRGVGMDAARTRIEALGGSLKVESAAGQGTRFRVRVPLSLAIIRALRVRTGGEYYMAPVANVVEAVEYGRADLKSRQGSPSVDLRGEPLPVRWLGELLGCPPAEPGPLFTVLVAESGERRAGLVVDEVLGQQEIAIKNLSRGLKSVRGFGGVTILGDGSVRLILDLPSLLGL